MAQTLDPEVVDQALSESESEWREEHAALRKGLLQGAIAFNVVLIAAALVDAAKWTSGRYLWYAIAFVLLNAGFAYAFWQEGLKKPSR